MISDDNIKRDKALREAATPQDIMTCRLIGNLAAESYILRASLALPEYIAEVERLRVLVRDYAEALVSARRGEKTDPALLTALDAARKRAPILLNDDDESEFEAAHAWSEADSGDR